MERTEAVKGFILALVVLLAATTAHAETFTFPANYENECFIDAAANGAPFNNFLLDTGTSDALTFNARDAKKLGFDAKSLRYGQIYDSWGAGIRAIEVIIREFRFRSFILRDVKAVIQQHGPADDTPMIGTPILKLLNFQIKVGTCIVSLPRE